MCANVASLHYNADLWAGDGLGKKAGSVNKVVSVKRCGPWGKRDETHGAGAAGFLTLSRQAF